MSRSDPPRFEAVALPQTVFERGGVELLRAIIVEGGLHVSLRRAFEQPDAWAPVLADMMRDIARAYAAATKISEQAAFAQLHIALFAEIGTPEAPVTRPARKSAKKAKAKRAKKRRPRKRVKKRVKKRGRC